MIEAWLGRWISQTEGVRPSPLMVVGNMWWLREHGYVKRFEYWSKHFCEKYSFALYARVMQVYYHQRHGADHTMARWNHDNDVNWQHHGDPENDMMPSNLNERNDWFDDWFDIEEAANAHFEAVRDD